MRAASADVVPLKFKPYGLALREHVDELRRLKAARVRNSQDWMAEAAPDFAGLDTLVSAVREFQAQAARLDNATEAAASSAANDSAATSNLNDALARVERAFLLPDGLPNRPWFKHAVYAPGLTTGYMSWPLPAIRERLEDPKTSDANLKSEVERTAARIKQATEALQKARECAESMINRH
jgi:N-acetylated-alpha-linked acidic dipeptidase